MKQLLEKKSGKEISTVSVVCALEGKNHSL